MKKRSRTLKIFCVLLLFLILYLFYFFPTVWSDYRPKNLVTLDDVNPSTITLGKIEEFLSLHKNETVVIFVTPFINDYPLTRNETWCRGLTSMKKEYNFYIGLHGCCHKGPLENGVCGEFLLPRPGKIRKAEKEFEKCFGFKPKYFRAPCFQMNIVDYLYIKINGMKNLGLLKHGKTYHPYPNIYQDWDSLHPSFWNNFFNKI